MRVGIGIGIISRGQVPLKWALRLRNIGMSIPGGMFWDFVTVQGKSWAEARTEVIKKAQEKNFKYLFFLDDDVFIPTDAIRRLLSHNKKIINGIYFTKAEPSTPVIFKEFGNGPYMDFEPDSLFKIGGAGLGCCLIDMEVFDKFDEKGWDYFKEDWIYESEEHGRIKCPVGEDHYFFIHAQKLGYDIWCDSSILCDHYCTKTKRYFPPEHVVRQMATKQLQKAGKEDIIREQDDLLGLNPEKETIVFLNHVKASFSGDEDRKRGIGGSEGDIIFLAREFQKKGYNVHVYCNCPSPGVYDGVRYHDIKNGLSDLKHMDIDHCIISRNTELFRDIEEYDCKRTYLWLHDMPDSPANKSFKQAYEKADVTIALTEFHKEVMCDTFNIDGSKIAVIGNGVSAYFSGERNEDPYKLIYTSTPYRGLRYLVDYFKEIKMYVPQVTLDVYSSMKVYGDEYADEDQNFQELYDQLRSTCGIAYKGTVTKERLGEAMRSSAMLVYPNCFPETLCCTVLEAEHAGLPVVTSKFAALKETCNPESTVLIEGTPKEKGYKGQFVAAVVSLLNNPEKRKRMSQNCKANNSWASKVSEWETIFGNKDIDRVEVNSKEYWDSVYEKEVREGKTRKEIGRFEILEELIVGNKIVDIGCGTGEFTDWYKRRNKECEVWGCDISHIALDTARSNNRTIFYANHPLHSDFEENYFDTVVSSHTLEHIKDPSDMLKTMHRILKDDGNLIIVLPYKDKPYHEHFHIFDEDNAVKLLEDNGFNVRTWNVRERRFRYDDGSPFREIILIGEKR